MKRKFYHGTWTPDYDISPLQTKSATNHRVPFLTSVRPGRMYLTGIIVDDPVHGGLVPNYDEVVDVGAFIEARLDGAYPKSHDLRVEMKDFAPYDIYTGLPFAYFIKYADGSWGYQGGTRRGSEFEPPRGARDETIQQVIERANKR